MFWTISFIVYFCVSVSENAKKILLYIGSSGATGVKHYIWIEFQHCQIGDAGFN